jgi:hypothetical protein
MNSIAQIPASRKRLIEVQAAIEMAQEALRGGRTSSAAWYLSRATAFAQAPEGDEDMRFATPEEEDRFGLQDEERFA